MPTKQSLPLHYSQLIRWIEDETRPLESKLIIVPTQQIGYEITTAMAKANKLHASKIPGIQQYRINTNHGDFLLDIEYADEAEDDLYITVISDRNLSMQIANLHNITTRGISAAPKLFETLRQAVGDFPSVTINGQKASG